jgi:uncharacterized damage-inducible protein DinB
MVEVERIAEQLRRAFEGEAWHGPSVHELLASTTRGQAAKRPIPGAHTIWEIVLHIGVWESVVRRRLLGESITDLAPEHDWPPVRDVTEPAWRKTLEELEQGHLQMRQAITQVTDERLNETVPGKDYTVYVMLHGIIQHDLYHAGQISLLKKAFA